jgi:hypothetical protein
MDNTKIKMSHNASILFLVVINTRISNDQGTKGVDHVCIMV